MKKNGTIATNASISGAAEIGKNVTIEDFVVIKDGAKIADGVTIQTGAIIYENAVIAENSFIGAQCIIGERLLGYLKDDNYVNPAVTLGANSIIRAGTILYANCSFGANFQTGNRAVIREESHFGDNCSFGTMSQSDGQIKIGDNCRFHNNVFIATFTTCEDNVHFYPMSCTTDSLHPPCQIGREGPYLESGVIVGARVLLLPRVRIGKGASVAGGSVVTHNVEPNMVVAGAPAKPIKQKDQIRCHIDDRPAYEVAIESLKKT
ncbi:MAG: DapH/DapD/GlmU-related protein [Candidatus Melainabacteria bacterium]|nr:DapH/DapD/GlmU-related protein [Candidatus Melainabacteria bacterium]